MRTMKCKRGPQRTVPWDNTLKLFSHHWASARWTPDMGPACRRGTCHAGASSFNMFSMRRWGSNYIVHTTCILLVLFFMDARIMGLCSSWYGSLLLFSHTWNLLGNFREVSLHYSCEPALIMTAWECCVWKQHKEKAMVDNWKADNWEMYWKEINCRKSLCAIAFSSSKLSTSGSEKGCR